MKKVKNASTTPEPSFTSFINASQLPKYVLLFNPQKTDVQRGSVHYFDSPNNV